MQNPIGVHSSVLARDASPLAISTAISDTKKAGFDLLELTLSESIDLDINRVRKELAAAGLRVVCSRGLSVDADVSSDDPSVVERGAALLLRSLELTRDLGGTHLTGLLYSALRKYGSHITPAGRSNVVAALRNLAKQAMDWDMTLGLEVVNRYETNVINTAHDALRLADDIGRDNVFIHLDTYHMNIEEADFAQPVLEAADRLAYVHVGENHRGYLGSGHIDFATFFRALAEIGYSGPVTFESFSSVALSERRASDLAVWRDLWSDGFELAKHARDFIANQLEASQLSA